MKNRLKSRLFFRCISILSVLFLFLASQTANAEPKKYPLGDIPLSAEEYQKHLKKTTKEMAVLEAALPPAYDARTEGIVTNAKNQGSCGSCWAFACTGALESHILRAGMPLLNNDLAEQQQVSCNTSQWGCDGGNSNALLYWASDTGPLYELTFPYTGSDATQCVENGQLGYRIADYHTVPVSTSSFKESLYSYGPSYWRYDVYSDFYTFWNSYNPGAVYVNQSNSYVGGHAVLLIGWDDTKQAFLCKNSWGPGGPNGDGTFWIAYNGHLNNLGFGMANFTVTSLTCHSDNECSDGNACNGIETCVNEHCQSGTAVFCPDDGLFCNGSEYCQEPTGTCVSSEDACSASENCIEEENKCEPLTCRNGVCDQGENCSNCSVDCISGSGGGTCGACFKGKCDGSCHPRKENASCSDCAPSWCCGDGACNGEENSDNCLIDCPAPPPQEICIGGVDEDEDGLIDCADPDCAQDPACSSSCLGRKEPCSTNQECCSGRCFRGKCK